MRFLLIYPPSEPYFIQKTKIFYGLSPPLGLLYIARILQDDGDAVTILDYSAEPLDEHTLIKAVSSADVVGMTLLTPAIHEAKKIIDLIKTNHPEKPIIIGGPHCTLLPKQALRETGASISIQGDGENVILSIKKALANEKALSDIPGIFFTTTKGLKHGPAAQPIEDLNTIPFPARLLVKHYIYGREYNPSLKAGEFTSIVTSRGCPYRCRFCSRNSISMQQFRMRSTENILEELKEIKQNGYRHVAFADDCFPVNRKQAFDLFKAIISEHLDLRFSIMATRVDLAERKLYKKMRQAGVTHIQFGLESGNQDVLDFYNKHTTVESIKKAVRLSDEAGFFTMGSFILGAPFETTHHFKKTVSFAQTLPLDSVSFLPLRYMIGSDLWNQAVTEGVIAKNDYLVLADKNTGLGQFSQKDLLRFCINAQRFFYARPAFFLHLIKKSLQNNDMSFMASYLSFISSFFSHKK